LFRDYPLKLQDRKWLNGIFALLYNVEADLDIKNCILHGDWPSSVEQLTRALEQAKEKRKIALDKGGGK
ncbi:MAG: hypothetical protein V1848_02415, partial [Candidatus Magasanikbacteria bacterium]